MHESHSSLPPYVQAIVFLAAAVIAVPLFRRMRLGSILGYLAAGLVIGPHGLRLFAEPETALQISELGVVLFLFVIGLELKLSRLWAMRRDIFLIGTLQVVLSGALVMLFPLLVVGRPWQASLIAGLGLALSSTAMVMQMLEERGETQQPHGQKAFAILLLQDLAIVPLLALVSLLSPRTGGAVEPVWLSGGKMIAAVAAVIVVGRYLLTPFFRLLAASRAREVMTAAALLLVITAASVMTLVGLSAALGAFLAGVMLAESSYRHELEADIEPFRGLLLGLFFMAVGMTVDLEVVVDHIGVLLAALVMLMTVKIGVVYGLVRATGSAHDVAIRTALLLPQGGEFGFVLFSTAMAAGVMPPDQPVLLVALVTMSMAVTPLLAMLAPRLAGRAAKRRREETFEDARGSVLVVGFGRFGQMVCQMLLQRGIDVIVIDDDIEMIEAAEGFGFKLYYGDGTRLEVLRAAGAERVRMVCVCVEVKERATKIVDLCRTSFPLVRVFVRSFDRIHALEVLDHGAHYQMRETFESALAFGGAALLDLGLGEHEVAEALAEVRARDSERFALQQQGRGDPSAGVDRLLVRPVPVPEPFVAPRREAVRLDGDRIDEERSDAADATSGS
jgi:monovalent cation:proton antiporter-2 (CPA2) family protein